MAEQIIFNGPREIKVATLAELLLETGYAELTRAVVLASGDTYEWRGATAGWVQTSFGGSVGVSQVGDTPSSLFETVVTAAAPATGVATFALDPDTRALEYKSLTAVAAEYCWLGFGETVIEAEANRDANQVLIKAGEIGKERVPSGMNYYSVKSASGTPIVHFQQKG